SPRRMTPTGGWRPRLAPSPTRGPGLRGATPLGMAMPGAEQAASQKVGAQLPALRLRVAAAFLAEADRSAAERLADACPPLWPPFLLETLVSFLPRPEPDLLPPPDSLLTVAQARRLASVSGTPRPS